MEKEKISGNMCKFTTLLILNFLTFALGIAILIIDFLILAKLKNHCKMLNPKSRNQLHFNITCIAIFFYYFK